MAQSVKNPPAMQEIWIQSLGQEGNGNLLHYACLGNPTDRGALQATIPGVARVRHNLATKPPPLMYWCCENQNTRRCYVQ